MKRSVSVARSPLGPTITLIRIIRTSEPTRSWSRTQTQPQMFPLPALCFSPVSELILLAICVAAEPSKSHCSAQVISGPHGVTMRAFLFSYSTLTKMGGLWKTPTSDSVGQKPVLFDRVIPSLWDNVPQARAILQDRPGPIAATHHEAYLLVNSTGNSLRLRFTLRHAGSGSI